jgi:hypothetical protein
VLAGGQPEAVLRRGEAEPAEPGSFI